MLSEPNELSRVHLRLFARQTAFVALFSVPALFLDQHKPALFFLVTREMFGFSRSARSSVPFYFAARFPRRASAFGIMRRSCC
jgi:hypothetical protein